MDLYLRDWVRLGLNQICQRLCDLKVMKLCLLLEGNLEEMRNGTFSVVVKSAFLVHPKVIMRAGGPEKMKYWNEPILARVGVVGQSGKCGIRSGNSLLKAAFNGHGRISLLIQGFSEGLDIVAVAMQGDFFGNSMSYMGNGYELLRQLVKEFSLRSRSEAVSLRASLMSKVFQANAAYGAPVADTIRQIEVAVARYLRLVSTLIDEDVNGLGVGDSDQLTPLIRSLAEPAKSYVLHHSHGESYGAYRRSALKYEHQQRLFLELQGNKKMFSLQPEGISELNVSNPEVSEGTPNMDGNIAGLKGDGKGSNVSSAKTRCSRCGQRDHDGSKCTTDLSKKRCFKCHEFGHISTNCRVMRRI